MSAQWIKRLIIFGLFIIIYKDTGYSFQMGDEKNMKPVTFEIKLKDSTNKDHTYWLGGPLFAGRDIYFSPETESPNIFHLPLITSKTFELENQFTGDVRKGGSCNLDVLNYIPHNLTHVETAAHIVSYDCNPPWIADIPAENFSGIVYVIDLTDIRIEQGRLISRNEIERKLRNNRLPVTMLAIKTKASEFPQDYDFSDKGFIALDAEAAKGIHDYSIVINSKKFIIDCLILDLPSIDPERDGGKLSAHRSYFGLPETGHYSQNVEKRILIELAYFSEIEEGYYYAVLTPSRFQTNAAATEILFWPLREK